MRDTDNTLRLEVIKLASKALDVLTKALDILAADDNAASGGNDQTASGENDHAAAPVAAVPATTPKGEHSLKEEEPTAKKDETVKDEPVIKEKPIIKQKDSTATSPNLPNAQSSNLPSEDTYRADAIRFNEQFLRDRYDLRYNTMLKTTEFRPKHPEGEDSPLPTSCVPLVASVQRPSGGGVGGETVGVGGEAPPKLLATTLRSLGLRQGAQMGQHGWYAKTI